MKHIELKKITLALLILAFILTPVLWKVYGSQENVKLAVFLFGLVATALIFSICRWINEAEKYSIGKTFGDLVKGDSLYYTDNCKVIKELTVKSIVLTQYGDKLEISATTVNHSEGGRNNYCFFVNPITSMKYEEDAPHYYMVSVDPRDVCRFAIDFNDSYSSVQRAGTDIKKDRVNDTIKQQYLAFKDKEVDKTKTNKK